MRHFHYTKNPHHMPVLNVENLWHVAGKEAVAAAQKEHAAKSGKAPVIDLVSKGIFKVLGKGRLPALPCIVKAKFFSKDAEKKIVAAGGACVLSA